MKQTLQEVIGSELSLLCSIQHDNGSNSCPLGTSWLILSRDHSTQISMDSLPQEVQQLIVSHLCVVEQYHIRYEDDNVGHAVYNKSEIMHTVTGVKHGSSIYCNLPIEKIPKTTKSQMKNYMHSSWTKHFEFKLYRLDSRLFAIANCLEPVHVGDICSHRHFVYPDLYRVSSHFGKTFETNCRLCSDCMIDEEDGENDAPAVFMRIEKTNDANPIEATFETETFSETESSDEEDDEMN